MSGPVLDLHSPDDLQKFRQIADEVAALVAQFKGSLAGEHGVGIARTEFLQEQVGAELYRVMREIKQSFDPNNLFNPGKIIGDGRYKIDRNLRQTEDRNLVLPFVPHLAFAARDESFVANLEQCNGCGGCLKQTPTMCPTFVATGEEGMSTRGRANLIRAVLEMRGSGRSRCARGIGVRAVELPVLPGLRHRMPVQCESAVAQGRTAACAHPHDGLSSANGCSVRWMSWAGGAAKCRAWPMRFWISIRSD